ncbi:MAG: MFS transporter [Cyclobacteriaceae bacterium]|jgi:FHS family glucose/mannose:H+ symporter-like MFS transporter|nr:MFS transporter [Cyclobacteriaceae bacterium]
MKNTGTHAFVFFSACLGMLLFGVTLITLGSVTIDIQQQFNLDAISSGTLFSILPFGILAGSLLFGPVADRFGYKIIFIVSSLAIFIGLEGIAFAPSLMVLKISVFFFGVGGGAINGAANGVVSDITSESKGANLSILGVFFAIGALGMPFILGLQEGRTTYQTVLSYAGYLAVLFSIIFMAINFPKPKLAQGVPSSRVFQLLKDDLLLVISFFLFCQSGFEAIINNWTTTYLVEINDVVISKALYALTLYVAGMAVMRLVLGSLLRKIEAKVMILISILLLVGGVLLLHFTIAYAMSVAGLLLLGAGLAAGFPVMLGLVGTKYEDVSGTAFSIVISIALTGNILLNYGMGLLVEQYGISRLTTLSLVLSTLMFVLTIIIFNKLKLKTNKSNASKTMA